MRETTFRTRSAIAFLEEVAELLLVVSSRGRTRRGPTSRARGPRAATITRPSPRLAPFPFSFSFWAIGATFLVGVVEIGTLVTVSAATLPHPRITMPFRRTICRKRIPHARSVSFHVSFRLHSSSIINVLSNDTDKEVIVTISMTNRTSLIMCHVFSNTCVKLNLITRQGLQNRNIR